MFDRIAALVGVLTFFVSTISLQTASFADNGPYISFLVGGIETEDVEVDDINVEYDTGFAFAGQFGYNFQHVRLGGEFGYQIADGESDNDVTSEVDIARFTLNGYLDLPIAPRFGPYVGGGIGVANLKTGDDLSDDFEDEDTAFTWHGEVGLDVGLNDQLFIAPVYRYQWTDSNIGGQSEPLISHIFGVSLRYQFYSKHHSSAYSEPRSGSTSGRHDSGYTSYGSSYDRYDRYDRYDHHDHHDHDHKPEKTPAELERDKCGWKGLGCEDED
ncbi:MAG: outer membrane protein [Geminicoccaceae bacterium]